MELEKNSNRPSQEGDINPNNPNQFRRHFAPWFIHRERRNNDIQRERREVEDQRVPPPLQNNVTDEGEEYYDANVFQTEDDLNPEVTADIYQYEPKMTLNLRSGPKQVAQNPRKKAVLPLK